MHSFCAETLLPFCSQDEEDEWLERASGRGDEVSALLPTESETQEVSSTACAPSQAALVKHC